MLTHTKLLPGTLLANQTKTIKLTFVARRPLGHIEELIQCAVAGMALPIGLALHADTQGLSVSYGIMCKPTPLAPSEFGLLAAGERRITEDTPPVSESETPPARRPPRSLSIPHFASMLIAVSPLYLLRGSIFFEKYAR